MAARRQSGEARRAQIAHAALRILSEGGSHRLTAKHLGAAVGIDHSTIFRHFEDKTAIVQAAIDLFEVQLQASFPNGEPGLDALQAFIDHRYGLVLKQPALVRLAFNASSLAAAGEQAQARRVHRIVRRSMAYIADCLQAAADAGEIDSLAQTQVLTWAVAGVVRGAATAPKSRRLPPEELWAQICDLIGASRRP